MDRQYRDEDYLREQYVDRRRSISEIADDSGVSSSTISRWLDRRDIEREPRYQQREWLSEQYVEERKSQQQIAEECSVAVTTICHWLSRLGITDGESMEESTCATCAETFRYYPSVRDGTYCSNDCAKEPQKRQVEITCVGCEETFTRRRSLDTEYCSMSCWSDDNYTIENRDRLYRGVWYEQRRKALRRDGHQCVVCGITNREHLAKFGQQLDVHHIVPVCLFAKWDVPIEDAHSLRNLKTVCREHHPDAPNISVNSDLKSEESLNGRFE